MKDLALITAAPMAEHYEISGYGSARTLAEVLGLAEVVELLQATPDEESTTNKNCRAWRPFRANGNHVSAAPASAKDAVLADSEVGGGVGRGLVRF